MRKKNRRSVSYNTLPSPHTTSSTETASTSSSSSSSPSLPSAGGLSMPDRFSLRSTKSYTSIPGAPSLSSSAISASASNLDDLSRPRKDFSIQTQLQQHFHLSANKYVSLLTATRHRPNAVAEEDDDGIDRSAWLQKALRKHPELQNLKERISPVSRAVAFGRTYNAPSTPDSGKEGPKPKGTMIVGEDMYLDKGKILQLIMQHLYHEGLKHSAHVLSGETNTDYMVNELNESRLVTLVRIALRDTERIWDLTVADKSHMDRQGDDDLEEHLNELEMLEEEPLEKDVNIWQEPVTGNITWSDKPQDNEPKSIHSASLNKLVENLTSPANPNMTFLKTFLLTYTTFTTAEKLLHKLIERYHVPQDRKPPNIRPEDWNTTTLMPIRLRVCNVLRKWIEEFEDELSSTRLLRTLKTFLETTLKPDGYVVLAEAMSAALARKMKQREIPPATITEPPPEPKVPRNVFSPSLSLMDINDEELARQLTLMEFETFRAIRPSELLNQVWNKPKQRHRAPNVVKMIRRFNEISNWVATSIVGSEKIRQRVKVMTKFLRLADILRKMNNFNTMVAVVAGINASAVHRLKWTKEEVMKGIWPQFAECERLMSNEGSYKTYRGALFQARPPCLPYLGVYLTDLTFIEDGNPDYVNELINFSKRSLIYTVIAKIQQFQLLPYNFYPIHQIWEYIKRFPSMEEAELYSTSLKIEPRKADRSEIL